MKNKTILIISPEPWGRNFVSKHHYANYLSEENTVFFLNPPIGSNKFPFQNFEISKNDVKKGLFEVSYKNLLPKLNDFPLFIQRKIYQKQAEKIQSFLQISRFDIVWSFDPFRFFDPSTWNHDRSIYHAVDFHLKAKYEEIIRAESKLNIVVSAAMAANSRLPQENFHRIGHGFAMRENTDNPIEKLPGKNKIKVGYVGNVNALRQPERFCELADAYPNCDFILIGPYKASNLSTSIRSNNAEILQRDNIWLMGSKPYHEIPKYLVQFDINLMIMKGPGKDPKTNSHKLMDYFYAGKVVISDWLLDYVEASDQLLKLAKNHDSFIKIFGEVVNNLTVENSEERQLIRRNFALENTYQNKIKSIYQLLERG